MGGVLRVLLVEDSETDAKLVSRELRLAGFEPELERVETAETMHEALHRRHWDIVLSDFTMPRFSAPAAFALLKAERFDIPFIIVSGTVGEDIAVQAMRLGVNDYVLKGKLTRLGPAIERELRECQAREASRRTDQKLKKTEEQLRQAQKMEAIGRLAGGVAHDFNNVLSVIIGYTSMVLESLNSDAPFRPELEEVNRAADSGAQLTRQLLAFSRQQVFEVRSVNLNELLFGMERMLRRVLGEDLELVIDADARLAKIHADPGQIEQIVMNLVVNARDAMPNGGKLTIKTSNVHLDADYAAEHAGSAPGSYALLTVTDTGVGMDAATRSRIFEPFFTTKERGKGTGLGLATVFGIVAQSQGHIEVHTEPKKGTTFKIYLPKRDTSTGSTHRPQPTLVTLQGTETILLVEDEERVRKMIRTILRRSGYNVLEASSGDEAVRVSAQHAGEIQLLVTDVIMPRMSGPELAERLGAMRPATKVLFLSGYTENARLARDVRSSRIGFLQKPVKPETLARKIREILDFKDK